MGDTNTIQLLSNINNSLNKIVEIMMPQNKDSRQKQAESIKNLSQGGITSATTSKEFVKKDSDKMDETIGTINVAQIVSALNGLPEHIRAIARLSGRTIQRFSDVLKTIIKVFNEDEFKQLDESQTKAAGNLIVALSKLDGLPDAMKSVSKIKEKDIKKFANSVGKLLELISVSLRKADIKEDDIKLAKNTADTILALTTAIKSLAKMSIIAPLAMIGLVLITPVWIAFGGLLMLIGKLGEPIQKGIETLEGVDKLMKKMMKTALLCLAVAGGVLLLGHFVKQYKGLMLSGIGGMMAVFVAVGAIAVLGGLIGLLIKSTILFNTEIIVFTLGLMLIAGLCIALGKLLETGWKQALFGFIGTTAILGLMLGVAAVINVIGVIALESVMAMGGVLFFIGGAMLIGMLSVALGWLITEHIDYAISGLVGTMTILVMAARVANVAKGAGQSAKTGILNILLCEGVILAAEVIVWSTIKLGNIIWEFFGEGPTALGKILSVSAFVTAIIYGALGVSRIANRASKDIIKGAVSLLLAEGVILTSTLVVAAVIKVSELIKKEGSKEIELTLAMMAGIVTAAAGVAAVASAFNSTIKKGAIVMAVVELLILGMALVVRAIVKTAKAAKELGTDGWKDVDTAVSYMGLLMVGFAGFIGAMGLLLTVPGAGLVFAIGAGSLVAITGLVYLTTGAVMRTIELAKTLEDSKKTTKDLGDLLKSLSQEVFTYENLKPGVDKSETANLVTRYKSLKPVFKAMETMIRIVSTMVTQFGGMIEFNGEGGLKGKCGIRPFYGMNGNQPIYGEAVYIPEIATQIVESVSTFVGTLHENFQEFDREDAKKIKRIGNTLGNIIDPVSKFIQALTTLTKGDTNGTLRAVYIVNGEIKTTGKDVNISDVASIIGSSISSFAIKLYGDGTTLPEWMKFTGKEKNSNRIKNSMGVLGEIITPIDTFVRVLASYQTDGTKIRKIVFDEKGNLNENSPFVDVVQVSKSISLAISTFTNNVFGLNAIWMKDFKKSEKSSERASNAMHTLAEVITPISSFVDAILSLEPDGNNLYAISIDDKGVIDKRPVNIVQTATEIANAISAFIDTLFSDKNKVSWHNMIMVANTSSGTDILVPSDNSSNKSIGVLSTIIDPISNFANAISSIGGTKGENGVLNIPIYNSEGVQVGTRSIDMEFTAESIAKSVTKFLQTLYAPEQINTWLGLIYGYDLKGNLGTTENNSLEKSIGVFAAIIDPVVRFMDMIVKFNGPANKFQIFDGEKPRTINLLETSQSISEAITEFINGIKPAFISIEEFNSDFGSNGTASDRKDIITFFAQSIGSILENFAKIGDTKKEQIDLSKTVFENYFEVIAKITEKSKGEIASEEDLDKIDSVIQKGITMLNRFKDNNFKEINYKNGFEIILDVFKNCKKISDYAIKIPKDFSFDAINKFSEAGKILNELTLEYIKQGLKDSIIEAARVYGNSITIIATTMSGLTLSDTNPDNMVKRFVSAGNVYNNLIDNYFNKFANNSELLKSITEFYNNAITSIGETLSKLPEVKDKNEIGLITRFVSAGNVYNNLIDNYFNKFANNSELLKSITEFYNNAITSIGETLSKLPEVKDKNEIGLITRFVSAGKTLNNLFTNYIKSLGSSYIDIESITSKYVNSIQTIALAFSEISVSDSKENRTKLWFIDPYVSAAMKVKAMISNDPNFANNAAITINVISEIGSSMLLLSEIPSTELDKLSESYNNLLSRIINLSDKKNTKSVTNMNNALKEATIQMTNFDERIIDKADERKKKMEELIESVAALNEKLEKTSDSMKTISEHLNSINRFNTENVKDVNPTINNSYRKPITNNKEDVFDNKPNIVPEYNSDIIRKGIVDALTDMKLTSEVIQIDNKSGDFGANSDIFSSSSTINNMEFSFKNK